MNNLAIKEPYSAESFDFDGFSSLIKNRNSRFHLDLSNRNLVEVLEAYALRCKRINPNYKNDSVINFIKRFEEYTACEIMPIDITDEFYVYANDFLSLVPNEHGKTLKPTSILNYFDNIRACLNWASKHKCPISETYNIYKLDKYEKTKIALTVSQISQIYHFKFDTLDVRKKIRKLAEDMNIQNFSFTMLEKVKDQFVIECNIGQRYSDASHFDRTNFDEAGIVYRCTQQKTGAKAVVNIINNSIDKDITLEILKKYNYTSPCSNFDISTVNKYIHLLCRAIGDVFNKTVKTTNKIRGKLVEEVHKMWQLVTTHTARRTYITYWANNNNTNIILLQKCTGHKDARQINNYTIVN